MPCPACQRESPEGAAFCMYCGAVLARGCAACGAELPAEASFCMKCGTRVAVVGNAPPPIERSPSSYTPRHLAERILQSHAALEGERKRVTVLFADVQGSTSLAERIDPEEWHRILDRFFQILSEGVHRFEGTVNQYTGDGIMALFGAPIAHEDHGQRACWAALHLERELRAYANELRVERGLGFAVRIGINSGEVVVGKIGDDLRMDYTAQGHTVNLAARMQQIAEPGRTYLADPAARIVEGYFTLESLGDTPVEGVSEPVPVYALSGEGPMRTRLDQARARGFSKFVGRSEEMATLDAALERAVSGGGCVVGIVADAGVGKSRLCHEFAERCESRGILVRRATGVSHGRLIPLYPILELFRASFGITQSDTEREARQKIAGAVVLVDDEMREDLPLLFDMLGVPDPERPLPPMDGELRQRRALELVRRFAIARSRQEPAVLVFEDLHWIDPATEAFVEVMVDATDGARTLLVANFRPEYRADWMHRSWYQQVALRPLDAAGVGEMLEEWLGTHASLDSLAGRICERTAGNAFFVEEVVQSLIESGALIGERGAYELVGDPDTLEIPSRVHAVLAARIDRLAEREKRVLGVAAVIGDELTRSILERVTEIPEPELDEALRELVKGEFLFERSLYPEPEYAFKHPLTREVAYDTQLRERRALLHAAAARALEDVHAAALEEKAALLAHHWEAADEPETAARWHARAAAWIGSNDPAQAVSHLRRVLDLLREIDKAPELLDVRVNAIALLLFSGGRMGLEPRELESLVDEGERLTRRLGDPAARARFLLNASYAHTFASNPDLAGAAAEEAIRSADASGDSRLRAEARHALAFFLMLRGPAARVVELVDQALEQLGEEARRTPGRTDTYPGLLGLRAVAAGWLGSLDESARFLERAAEAAADSGDRTARYLTDIFAGLTLIHSLGPSAALSRARQAVELADQVGSAGGGPMARTVLTSIAIRAGDLEAAIHAKKDGPSPVTLNQPLELRADALVAIEQGDAERARAAIQRALEVAHESGQHMAELMCGISQAEILRRSRGTGAASELEEVLARLDALVGETGARLFEPLIREERAALAGLRGDEAARERELRETLRLWREMGGTWEADRLEAELADLP